MTTYCPFATAAQFPRHRNGAETSNVCDASTTALGDHELVSTPHPHPHPHPHRADWLEDFACLLGRCSGLGVEGDIHDMAEDDLIGLHRFLQRKAMIHDERMRNSYAGSR